MPPLHRSCLPSPVPGSPRRRPTGSGAGAGAAAGAGAGVEHQQKRAS